MSQNFIHPLDDYEPVIATWLWALQDTRQRTLESLEGLDDQIFNWVPPDGTNSIGSLLYHIAAVEMSWLYEDVLRSDDFPPEIDALMNHDVREDGQKLTSVIDESLDNHLNRLSKCRQNFLSAFKGMSIKDFHEHRKMDDYEVTPEWVIHHLMQHEAEHRGQIGEIRGMAERALGKA
jgi:uncharacterized damage-inducible protein DinB